MAKIQIKSETRHELSFFPNSFDDYVPKDSKVRMVDRIVCSMDINPLMDTYDGIGAPPYSPKMLLSLVILPISMAFMISRTRPSSWEKPLRHWLR